MQATRVKTETARYHQGMHAPLRRAVRRDGKDMHALRCMASRAGREKSWAEIAGEAFQLARQAGGKVVEGIRDVGNRLLLPKAESSREEEDTRVYSRGPRYQYGGGLDRPDSLFGRTAGGLFGGMMEQVVRQMEQGSAETGGILEQSISRIQNDDRVSSALGGGVQIVPGMRSQSSSTAYFNGRKVQETSIGFNIVGGSGRPASAQASVKDGEMDVTVRLPDGRVITVSEGGGAGGFGGRGKKPTEVIDVEWREVR